MSEKDKKKVLEEGAIRRWMDLSGNSHRTETFLSKLQESVLREEEDLPPEGDMPPMDAAPEGDMPPVGGGLDLDPAAVEQLVKVIADAISAATGTEVGVSGDAAPAPGEDMPPTDALPPAPEEEAPLEEEVVAKAYKGDMKDQEYKKAKTSTKNTGPLEEEVYEEEAVEEGAEKLEEVEDLMEGVVNKVMARVLEELKKKR